MDVIAYHLGIELTENCNLDCSHCFRGENENKSITREIIEKIFDEVKYVYILDLSGGEVFLGYNELKMLLEIAKEKGTIIENCSMFTNGTIYDERIYNLLDNYFGNNYQVAISDDDFHEKSIIRIYGQNEESLEKVNNNMSKHLENPHNLGFIGGSRHLIDTGRAVFLDTPKKQFEALGYYYDVYSDKCFAGPMIFIDANGYISDINSEISKRKEESIGNILENTIYNSLVNGGIKIKTKEPFEFFSKREDDFYTHKGDHLIFKNNKMAYTTYTKDTKYWEAVNKVESDMEDFIKAVKENKIAEFFENWDPIYDGDLSQIEHEEYQKVLNH